MQQLSSWGSPLREEGCPVMSKGPLKVPPSKIYKKCHLFLFGNFHLHYGSSTLYHIQALEHEWLQFLLRNKTHACKFHVGRVCKRWTSGKKIKLSTTCRYSEGSLGGLLLISAMNIWLESRFKSQDHGSRIEDSYSIGNSRTCLQVRVYWTSICILWDVWNPPLWCGSTLKLWWGPVLKILVGIHVKHFGADLCSNFFWWS